MYSVCFTFKVRLEDADMEFEGLKGAQLHIRSLNVTLDPTQYDKENCVTCPLKFAVWICAEDFNPDWWRKHVLSSARYGHANNQATWMLIVVLTSSWFVCISA